MLPIRNISYLLPICCSFWEKCKNSPKTGLGCSTPLRALYGITVENATLLRSVHTTLQLRCSADILITFCRKSPQRHHISSSNELTFMRHHNAVTLQFLCSRVQCGNATQLRCSMNGPLTCFMNVVKFMKACKQKHSCRKLPWSFDFLKAATIQISLSITSIKVNDDMYIKVYIFRKEMTQKIQPA